MFFVQHVQRLPDRLDEDRDVARLRVPVTWFVRVDGQLRDVYGSSLYLLESFAAFWDKVTRRGDELAWHPHLYRRSPNGGPPELITDPAAACDELEGLWQDLARWPLAAASFRNGEGWHVPATLCKVEQLGIRCDSTAIPGRVAGTGHPLDWAGTPNEPYFPGAEDIRRPGAARPLVELPMNTWYVRAPYDAQARLRYMDPAVHAHIFSESLAAWPGTRPAAAGDVCVWVLICHPDELLQDRGADALYGRSPDTLCRNLASLAERAGQAGHACRFVTLSEAGRRWRESRGSGA